MADRLTLQDNGKSLSLLIVDALAFWLRNQAVFWLVALPIAGLGATIAFVLDRHQQFAGLRNHWGWDFLFALVYAMFLDRWMKITLVDGASPCDEIDNLRRSIIAVRLLVFAACFPLLAMIMSMIHLEGIAATLVGWHLPLAIAVPVGTLLSWLPHLFFWATLFALVALMLPSLSAASPSSLGEAFVLGRPVRAPVCRLIFGSVLLSFATYVATKYALEFLPKKPWAAAAMAGTWRLVDCLLLAVAGYVLATIWRDVADWRQPEPENHPFRNMKLRVRGPAG